MWLVLLMQNMWFASHVYLKEKRLTSSFIAELWAPRDTSFLRHSLHLTTVEIELDANYIIDLLANSSYSVSPQVDDCRQLI